MRSSNDGVLNDLQRLHLFAAEGLIDDDKSKVLRLALQEYEGTNGDLERESKWERRA